MKENLEVKYPGLPSEIKFCKRCVISNQRPSSKSEFTHNINSPSHTIEFDEEGVCAACRYAEKKEKEVNWKKREEELRALCDKFRKDDGSYDCIAPGSGGKDSVMAAHLLKHKFGMHPLTVTWAPHMYTDVGWRNHQRWIKSGFDNILFHPNGKVHRLLTKLAFENLLHPFQPFILGQKNLAPKMAARFNIPLIFYGEPGIEYGDPANKTGKTRTPEYHTGSDYMNMHLGGTSAKD